MTESNHTLNADPLLRLSEHTQEGILTNDECNDGLGDTGAVIEPDHTLNANMDPLLRLSGRKHAREGIFTIGEWNDGLGDTRVGMYQYKHARDGEPLEICCTTMWQCWTTCDSCKICLSGPHYATYELEWEWGDTKKYEYVSEVCSTCLNKIAQLSSNAKHKIYD